MSDRTIEAVVFGSTGTAGSGVIEACVEDPRVAGVRAFSRRPLDAAVLQGGKVEQVLCEDFADLSSHADALTGVDACFFCLGISALKAPDEEAYTRITHAFAMEAARRLLEHSPRHAFHFLSGSGAGHDKRAMWARVKARTEDDLAALGLASLVCWRPGYIRPTASRGLTKALEGAAYRFARAGKMATTGRELGRAMLAATFAGIDGALLFNADVIRLAAEGG